MELSYTILYTINNKDFVLMSSCLSCYLMKSVWSSNPLRLHDFSVCLLSVNPY